jgi:hypothetical protein
MKRFVAFSLISIILLFSACSVKENFPMECVNDNIDAPALPCFRIEAELPQQAVLTLSGDDGRFAVFSHADYTITEEIFPAASWDAAFVHITGRDSDSLRPILAGNFPFEKYRCAWSVAGENGTKLCQCTLVWDGSYYYAVSVECAAEKAPSYEKLFSSLLSGVQLEAI